MDYTHSQGFRRRSVSGLSPDPDSRFGGVVRSPSLAASRFLSSIPQEDIEERIGFDCQSENISLDGSRQNGTSVSLVRSDRSVCSVDTTGDCDSTRTMSTEKPLPFLPGSDDTCVEEALLNVTLTPPLNKSDANASSSFNTLCYVTAAPEPSNALPTIIPSFRLPRLPTADLIRKLVLPSSLRINKRQHTGSLSSSRSAATIVAEDRPHPKLAANMKLDLSPASLNKGAFNPYLEHNVMRLRSPAYSSEPTRGSNPLSIRPSPIRAVTNFTNKFPIPISASNAGNSDALAVSETCLNLGFEKVGSWAGHKWVLMVSVCTVFLYGLAGLVCVLGVWFQSWPQSAVTATADSDILLLITVASTLLILTSLIGISGALLNSRAILAFYTILLWPCFLSMLTVGYKSYKRKTFSLDRKLSEMWSQSLDSGQRLLIQQSLHCCGFFNPLHEATMSAKCYPRTTLPGCKGKFYRFEKENLYMIYSVILSLVPVHILNMVSALLCSNHVNRIFGKGLTPKQYRLTAMDVRSHSQHIVSDAKE